MATQTVDWRVRNRIDTAENWSAKNSVLLAGEIGIESDTLRMKAGDGTTAWNDLSYIQAPSNVTVSINSDGADTYIEVPVENLIFGSTEPTDQNSIWMEVKE